MDIRDSGHQAAEMNSPPGYESSSENAMHVYCVSTFYKGQVPPTLRRTALNIYLATRRVTFRSQDRTAYFNRIHTINFPDAVSQDESR